MVSESDSPWPSITDKISPENSFVDSLLLLSLPRAPALKRPHSPCTTEGAKRLQIDTQDDWFIELHSKIWDRKDLLPDLFRKTCVTRRHYELLQSHLEKWYPNDGSFSMDDDSSSSMDDDSSSSMDYDSSSSMDDNSSSLLYFESLADGSYSSPDSDLLVKLQILRPTEAPSPASPLLNTNAHQSDQSHVEDAGDINDVDDELDSLFPTTIQYMDFSSLGLRKQTNRLPMPLLLREEYSIISRRIERLPYNAKGCVVVSGQPGTGEALLLLH